MSSKQIEWKLIAPANGSNFPQISSGEFQELLSSGKKATLLFFRNNLFEVVRPWPHPRINITQVNYVARFLTRLSMTTGLRSQTNTFFVHLPSFDSLVTACDALLSSGVDLNKDSGFLEKIACQILFLGGFYFNDAVKFHKRQDIENKGQDYFRASAIHSTRKKVLEDMAKNFKIWQDFLCYLNWRFAELREESLLIRTEKPPEPLIKLTGK